MDGGPSIVRGGECMDGREEEGVNEWEWWCRAGEWVEDQT